MLKTENDSIRSMKRREIQGQILKHVPDITNSEAHRLAGSWQRAAQRRDLGFYEALRISGIISDPTPRDAVRNVERSAA